MGRQSSDPAIAGPSIALLQERFRQLQRLKEQREERQLLDLISEPKRFPASTKSNHHQSSTNISFSNELILPSRPHFQDPLALGLNLNSKHAEYRDAISQTTWPTATRSVRTQHKFDIVSDVDTSLHL